jgi:hypothetical protein
VAPPLEVASAPGVAEVPPELFAELLTLSVLLGLLESFEFAAELGEESSGDVLLTEDPVES